MLESDDIELVPTRRIEEYEPRAHTPAQPFKPRWADRRCRIATYALVAVAVVLAVIVTVAIVLGRPAGVRPCSVQDLEHAGCSPYADCTRAADDTLACTCRAGFTGSGQYCVPSVESNTQVGAQPGGEAGFSVWPTGDVNGDGLADFILGAPFADGTAPNDRAGIAFVVYGRRGASAPFIDLASFDATTGFAVPGRVANGSLGYYVSGQFDFNGDGVSDFVLGAGMARAPMQASGSVYVVFGRRSNFPRKLDLDSLDGTNGFALHGAANGDRFGISVAAAGDLNGDGLGDLVVGAAGVAEGRGAAYVVFGTRDALLPAYTMPAGDGPAPEGLTMVTLEGMSAGDECGIAVNPAGDFNGDNVADVIVGAQYAAGGVGGAYIVFGRASWPASIALGDLAGSGGVRFVGAVVNDRTGFAVSGAGDIDGDGLADVLIGAYEASPFGKEAVGAVYVIYGSRSLFPSPLSASLHLADGTWGFTLVGGEFGDQVGVSVSPGGDFNRDGVADFVVGAFAASPLDAVHAGAAYVVFGRRQRFSPIRDLYDFVDGRDGFTFYGRAAGDELGTGVAGVGDFNGDGIDDVVLGGSYGTMLGRDMCGYTLLAYGRIV